MPAFCISQHPGKMVFRPTAKRRGFEHSAPIACSRRLGRQLVAVCVVVGAAVVGCSLGAISFFSFTGVTRLAKSSGMLVSGPKRSVRHCAAIGNDDPVDALLDEESAALPPLEDRVFLVTGSTSGIGLETVKKLLKKNCTVLMHSRKEENLRRHMTTLANIIGNRKVDGFLADLSDMSEVREFAEMVKERHPVIHGVLHNAASVDGGDFFGDRKETLEHNEMTLAVNVLAPFLLTAELLEPLIASGAGRVIFTTSAAMNCGAGASALKDLQYQAKWTGSRAYCLSKLCNAMLAVEMDKRYGNPPLLCFHAVDPGPTDTRLSRHLAMWGKGHRLKRRDQWLRGGTFPSPHLVDGPCNALTDDDLQFVSGKVLTPELAKEVLDDELRAKLWDDLEQIVGQWPDLFGEEEEMPTDQELGMPGSEAVADFAVEPAIL